MISNLAFAIRSLLHIPLVGIAVALSFLFVPAPAARAQGTPEVLTVYFNTFSNIPCFPLCTDVPGPITLNAVSVSSGSSSPVQVTFNGGNLYNEDFCAGTNYYETTSFFLNNSCTAVAFQPQITISFSSPVNDLVFLGFRQFGPTGNNYSTQITHADGTTTTVPGVSTILPDGQGVNATNISSVTVTALVAPGGIWGFGLGGVFANFFGGLDFGPITFQLSSCGTPTAGTLTATPSSGVPGTTVLVTGTGWVNPPNNEYQLLFNGVPAAAQTNLSCGTQPNMTFDIPCDTSPGPHKITNQLVRFGTVIASEQTTFQVSPLSSLAGTICAQGKVVSVEFEAREGNEPLTVNHNPTDGKELGKRIFPDKLSPKDPVTLNRNILLVKAKTTFLPGTTIFFKSFDVDDPSTDDPDVDCNGPNGDDNRGDINNGGISKDGQLLTTSAVTDNSGIAEVKFAVTMFPGDNFRLAASDDKSYLDKVSISQDGLNLIGPDGKQLDTSNPKAGASELLTVWRRVHVEVDTMDVVVDNQLTGTIKDAKEPNRNESCSACTALTLDIKNLPKIFDFNRFENGKISIDGLGDFTVLRAPTAPPGDLLIKESIDKGKAKKKSFILVDDDDFNGDNQKSKPSSLKGDEKEKLAALEDTFALMQDSDEPSKNVYAAAFIQPDYTWAANQGYNDSNIPFILNFDDSSNNNILAQAESTQFRNSKSDESDDFWIVYVPLAYQGNETHDNDPDGPEDAFSGIGIGFVGDKVGQTGGCPSGPLSVPAGAQGTLVYLEVSVDAGRDITINDATFSQVVTAHEVGHQFGLQGDRAGFAIMSRGYIAKTIRKFVAGHLNIMRSRRNSPGN